jgi:hypothetical protein
MIKSHDFGRIQEKPFMADLNITDICLEEMMSNNQDIRLHSRTPKHEVKDLKKVKMVY